LTSRLKSPLHYFILAVKLFILEVPVNKDYKKLELACNTTHNMDNRIRQCIFKFFLEEADFLNRKLEMDESYFGGRRKVKRGRSTKGKGMEGRDSEGCTSGDKAYRSDKED
jgi:uncharacterized protein YdaU (DUF1376 family)